MVLCSIAIAAGVVGVASLVKRLFLRRRFGGGPWALASCGPGFGGHGYRDRCGSSDEEGGGHGRWRRRGWGRGFGSGPGGSFWLRAIFSRLDTTPGQEREIRAAVEEFQQTAHASKDGLKGAREELARAIRGESFDEIALAEASSRADATTTQVKDALAAALKRVHAVLDKTQRERLAELLVRGPGSGRRWGNPYRDAAI
jgi:hypothetical protein